MRFWDGGVWHKTTQVETRCLLNDRDDLDKKPFIMESEMDGNRMEVSDNENSENEEGSKQDNQGDEDSEQEDSEGDKDSEQGDSKGDEEEYGSNTGEDE